MEKVKDLYHVHKVTEGHVAGDEERVANEEGEEAEDPLRELGHEEKEENG
jgi:hypothetical protein